MNEVIEPKKKKKTSRTLLAIFAIVIIIASSCGLYISGYNSGFDNYYEDEYYAEDSMNDLYCNVLVTTLHGELMTYVPMTSYDTDGYIFEDYASSEDIVYAIEDAESDPSIKAIIIEIDSVGGGPTAGQEIAEALKRAIKPTVAIVREYGISAAYYAATGADIIFASKNSDVGGIGVTMSYLDNSKKNQQEGLTYNSLSSGKYKDAGNFDKILTYEEKQLLMRDVAILHNSFVNDVAANRGMDINRVKQLADGSSMLGQMALDNGLIDQLGGWYEARQYLKEKLNEDIEVCWQ